MLSWMARRVSGWHPQVLVHSSIVLFGFTGVLGPLTGLSTLWLVWWRMGVASFGFTGLSAARSRAGRISWRQRSELIGIGVGLAIHWLFFFEAIAESNVSVALVMVATAPLMTAFLEPLLTKRKLLPSEVVLGLLAVVGIYLIYGVSAEYVLGIVYGLLAALTSALYGIQNKKMVDRYSPQVVNAWEIGGGWAFLGLVALVAPFAGVEIPAFELPTSGQAWVALLALALLCTNFAYIISLLALRHVSVFEYVLAINLEPIYGILLAWAFLGETYAFNLQFLAGALLVIGSVFVAPVLRRVRKRRIWARPGTRLRG